MAVQDVLYPCIFLYTKQEPFCELEIHVTYIVLQVYTFNNVFIGTIQSCYQYKNCQSGQTLNSGLLAL